MNNTDKIIAGALIASLIILAAVYLISPLTYSLLTMAV
jgi:hypothetical protein